MMEVIKIYQKSIEEIKSELTKKQFSRFLKLIERTKGQDKLDVLAQLSKKRFLRIRKW